MLLKEERNSKNIIAGVGLSARPQHYSALLKEGAYFPWLEVLADNYLFEGSPRHKKLEQLAMSYPIVFHCVGFNIASEDVLSEEYLSAIEKLSNKFNPAWISDHLCFNSQGAHHSPDLLPIPYTDKLLSSVSSKINQIIDRLKTPFLMENVSSYIRCSDSEMSEEEFLAKLTEQSGCGILLDVNNLYVNSKNYSFDPFQAFLKLPVDRIKQIHLAGHTDYGTYIIDTHSENIQKPVLDLFKRILEVVGTIPVTIERDDNIPPFEEMLIEADRVKEIYDA